jgi:hypothetical protein
MSLKEAKLESLKDKHDTLETPVAPVVAKEPVVEPPAPVEKEELPTEE